MYVLFRIRRNNIHFMEFSSIQYQNFLSFLNVSKPFLNYFLKNCDFGMTLQSKKKDNMIFLQCTNYSFENFINNLRMTSDNFVLNLTNIPIFETISFEKTMLEKRIHFKEKCFCKNVFLRKSFVSNKKMLIFIGHRNDRGKGQFVLLFVQIEANPVA